MQADGSRVVGTGVARLSERWVSGHGGRDRGAMRQCAVSRLQWTVDTVFRMGKQGLVSAVGSGPSNGVQDDPIVACLCSVCRCDPKGSLVGTTVRSVVDQMWLLILAREPGRHGSDGLGLGPEKADSRVAGWQDTVLHCW